MGESGYGDKAMGHMCCHSPIHRRGRIPRRCICPPRIRLQQLYYDCQDGNALLYNPDLIGGLVNKPLNDPQNMNGALFSFTSQAFRNDTYWLLL